MSLQDASRLHMSVLGIIGHSPLREDLPQLPDGVHLRWFFGLERGFPRGGYYLFRRPSNGSKPIEVVTNAVRALEDCPPTQILNLDCLGHSCQLKSLYGELELGESINRQNITGLSSYDGTFKTIRWQGHLRFALQEPYFANSIKVWVKTVGGSTNMSIELFARDKVIEEKSELVPIDEITQFTLEGDGLTGIRLNGLVQLVALEYKFVDPRANWQYLNPSPILLPVRHPTYDYRPTSYLESKTEAVERIHTGSRDKWENDPSPFKKLHDSLLEIVGSQGPMDQVTIDKVQETNEQIAKIKQFKYLEWIRLAALDPVVAQMLGLCWLDEKNENDAPRSGKSYDYMVLANHQILNPDLNFITNLQNFMNSTQSSIENFPGIAYPEIFDVWICTSVRLENDTGVMQPEKPRAYALPRPGGLGQVGLHLENIKTYRPQSQRVIKPDTAIMYQVWRQDFGQQEPTTSPDMNLFSPLDLDPIIPVRGTTAGQQTVKSGWPPRRMHAVDVGIGHEGWYGYCISAIDIFGRHSSPSQPARWWQWYIPPPYPKPWYFLDTPGDSIINEFAVRILDKIAPAPPNHIEATITDPQDPFLLKDQAYKNWLNALSNDKKEICGLRVSWRWTDQQKKSAPDAQEFRIYLKSGRFNSATDTTIATEWEKRIHITDISQKINRGCYPRLVADGSLLMGKVAERQGALVTERVIQLPESRYLSTVVIGVDHIYLATALGKKVFKIVSKGKSTVKVDSLPKLKKFDARLNKPSKSDWWIGPAYDHYEVFLPAPGATTIESVLPVPPLDEPILRAQIGISTADDKQHTSDDPVWSYSSRGGLGNREGNESVVGGPREVLRVRRIKPDAPELPLFEDSENIYATPADYHSRSFYTYRWVPSDHMKAHIFRAIDESVYKADWRSRPADHPDLGNMAFAVPWNDAKKDYVTAQLETLNSQREQYLAELDELYEEEVASLALGSEEATHLKEIRRKNIPAYAMASYRALSNDALRVLASSQHVKRAFTQITIKPLDPDETADAPGPDDPDGYELVTYLRKFMDTLDGRSTNKYFYRVAYVDNVQNVGEYSLATPPIYLPNVVPPRKPVVTKVLGGDREVILQWASNPEADLREYSIYRTTSEKNARDIRLMELVDTITAPSEPSDRPDQVTWSDTNVTGLKTYFYRLVAVDIEDKVSLPTNPIKAKSYQLPPEVPVWLEPVRQSTGSEQQVILNWEHLHLDEIFVKIEKEIQLFDALGRARNTRWKKITDWLQPGVVTFVDTVQSEDTEAKYRIQAKDSLGQLSTENSELLVAPQGE